MHLMRDVYLLPLAACMTVAMAHPACTAAAELQLASDFSIAQVQEMPCPVTAHWCVTRRDYPAFNAIEWQVGLRAPNSGNSPLFEQVKSADCVIRFPDAAAVTLHWSKGSHAEPSDFRPCRSRLARHKTITLESFGGRSSDGVMPYFNLAIAGTPGLFALGAAMCRVG